MSGKHSYLSNRFYYDGSMIGDADSSFDPTQFQLSSWSFDGAHGVAPSPVSMFDAPDGSVIGDAESSSDPTQFQFSNWSLDGAQGSMPSPVFMFDAFGGSMIGDAELSFDSTQFQFSNWSLDGAQGIASSPVFMFDALGGSMIGDAELSFDPTQFQFSNWSLDGAQGIASFPVFMFDALGGTSAPTAGPAAGAAIPAFEHGIAVSDAVAGGGGDITPIDTEFAAKGGKPGGGGGGGGGDSGALPPYFSGSGDGDAGYDIWIEFKGSGWTVGLQDAFIKAADYYTTVITDDIGGGGLYRGKIIDDLYVTAELKSIDGTGGILGQAGPTAVWTATELTAAGQMQFDIADAQYYFDQGLWDDIVTHEFTHVLGFGSLWNYGADPLVSGNRYEGASGLDAYQRTADSSADFIPVETDGGSGTAGAHWDDATLNNELMTGYINNDGNPATNADNYLSEFSVMSLDDLGYKVAYQDYPYDGLLIP
jgi:hypothetical protein